ncbi:hypothetical protein J2I47_04260 [Fibrella sp. HMF5335]|uniref:Uncharacterized protein n=1 Tax=Fibrella rubiginis TaxID=2817060 RepID=A0A939K1Z1_9BACT|nr:hypothetical protein [Fibrella rubiginis]MBO0935754.1 hypothetical protein [Fibrella rubiginis]
MTYPKKAADLRRQPFVYPTLNPERSKCPFLRPATTLQTCYNQLTDPAIAQNNKAAPPS